MAFKPYCVECNTWHFPENGHTTLGALDLQTWLKARLDNCQRIAATKTGKDRDGWLEDAAYFNAALNALAQLTRHEQPNN